MKYLKLIFATIICACFFLYGMASLEYKIFPYYYIMQAKIYMTHVQDQYQSTKVLNTFLQRLLVKKVFIDSDLSRGGGIANIEQYVFIITNKGKLLVFDKNVYKKIKVSADTVPMNYGELLSSKYPSMDDFRLHWFRVSGIYAEKKAGNRFLIFATHHFYDKPNDCVQHQISRIELELKDNSLATVQPWQTIFTAKPCIELSPKNYSTIEPFVGQEGGGKIIAYNDSTLMVSVGNYGKNGLENTEKVSLDSKVPYGKIILVNKYTGAWSVYALGIRNPLGLIKDENGIVWETENGPKGGDELNIIEKGMNYGWPNASYGVWYFGDYKFGNSEIRGSHSGYKKPLFSWVPAIAPNNLVRIEGDKFKEWNGDLIIGTMKDKSLRRMRLSDNNRVIYDEKINIGHRIRDLTVFNDNTLAMITDDGFLIIIDDGGSVFEEISNGTKEKMSRMNNYDAFSEDKLINREIENRLEMTSKVIFDQNCGNCHNIKPQNTIGPHLNNVINREIGSLTDFNYSTTLLNDRRTWTPSLLKSFLMQPELEFQDNQMPKVNLSKAEVDSIIVYLKKRRL